MIILLAMASLAAYGVAVFGYVVIQAVIGICNSWGDIIVRDPGLDIFDVIQKCTDLLLNGLSERRKKKRTSGTSEPLEAS